MVIEEELKREAAETWCAGQGVVCGYYNIRNQFIHAVCEYMNKHDLTKKDVIGVSGIGCSGRFTTWQDFTTVHTTHGNAANLVQGVSFMRELGNKKSLIYAVSGDGDALAIGRANFIDLCHGNHDVTYMILNNGIYAMTSGQTAPTTKRGTKTSSSPHGTLDKEWDVVELALFSGATFVARCSAYSQESAILKNTLLEAFEHKGASIVEIMSPCPTQNPYDKGKSISQLQERYMNSSIDIRDIEFAKTLSELDNYPLAKYQLLKNHLEKTLPEKTIIKGIIHNVSEPTFAGRFAEQKRSIISSLGKESLCDRLKEALKKNKIK